MKLLLALVISLLSISLFAGEGHDHGPGQVQPTKGGVILKGHKFFLEVVGSKSEVKLYPLKQADSKSLILSAIPLNQVKVSATYSLPRGKGANAINLKENKDYFSGEINAQGSHRYQVDVSIETLGEKEKLTYQIEPQE